MGLLTEGQPLSWAETQKYAEHVRQHGIKQFINLYHRLKDRQDECLKWGDEVEYMLVKFDSQNRKVRVLLTADEMLKELKKEESDKDATSLWHPEFAAYMIEATPKKPYLGSTLPSDCGFNSVEANMRARRLKVESLLKEDEALFSITSFPRLGCPDFTFPHLDPTPNSGATRSLFFPDGAIFPGHPRFKTLVQNIRARRGRKVIINIPIYKDVCTPDPFFEEFDDAEAKQAIRADHVYMDAMGFGMGCCCLQVTFQASNLCEARTLYDSLTPLCPIVMALTAASPIHKGYLTDRDCRWAVIAASVDDRTKEELGEEPLKNCKFRINKSRYDSVDSYISHAGAKYNDIPLTYDPRYYEEMIKAGVDPLIAQHVAHLFIRDPITLYLEKLNQDDENETDHFENIQSTNWQTMRFKPPPPNSSIGWRVEFRPMEVQITEFENAAFVVFVVLLTRIILSFQLNLLIPISKVDENMKVAQKRDAVRRGRFWFRKDIITLASPPEACKCVEAAADSLKCSDSAHEKLVNGAGAPEIDPTNAEAQKDSGDETASANVTIDESCILMSVDEIINGKEGEFPGLVPLIRQYLASVELDVDTQCTLQQYLNLISKRASGELLTTAAWIRDFVQHHGEYQHDSRISEGVCHDLLQKILRITKFGDISDCRLFDGSSLPKTKSEIR